MAGTYGAVDGSSTFVGRRATPLAASPSEQLLALVAASDDRALAELYDRYGKVAYALALRILRDRALAEDAVQEAFVAIWRMAAQFRAERGGARAWILTLVRRRAVDRVRHEQRHADLAAEAVAAGEPLAEAGTSLEQLHVREALMRLSRPERKVLELAYYEGLTQEEVAAALDIPVGTVKSRTARALARLARSLGHSGQAEAPDALAG
jgi:RNA polymerase sigma-70 factor (ECF subfamily)